ncbi:molybdate ABC transporter substrate-binding protein [Asticcacaulis sp. 201]|uniref:molybdate ABC transporter substrate-binding protein n=1 Tax=Asticcacaulis sp. 201 TaxID=3028787 RepID=UPI0029167AE4|nr:molybdate ABC transporter substrate-binding protein [Asticcacaulis sp. 201]MDV6333132.1 molybdate ABC transporter substrate-binding protein [Asticcacaulis sp. 201]
MTPTLRQPHSRQSLLRRAVITGMATIILAFPALALAKDIQVAVAANFTEPAKDIAQAFEKKTGTHVVMMFGASGAFYSQIQQGAPFDVMLSADAERPFKLEDSGLGIKGTRFTYAYGKLVLWSANPALIDPAGKVLAQGNFQHLAIADPVAAPYGAAAVDYLRKRGLYDALAPKIVKGASIAQAFSFIDTGSAELGFVALSQIHQSHKGSRWVVPIKDYPAIEQQAILLKDSPEARAYLAFLKSSAGLNIIKSYGYDVK